MIKNFLKLEEIKLTESNSYSIKNDEILKIFNLNKEISNQHCLGNEYIELKNHLNNISDVIFFFNILLSFKLKDEVRNSINSYYQLFLTNSSNEESPFLFYDKFSFSANTQNISIFYKPSDLLLTLCFAVWTLWNINFNITNNRISIYEIFASR